METVTLPLSKSILNRCLVLSALSKTSLGYMPPDAQLPHDVLVMKQLLFENNSNIFNVEDAGTVFRFLTAYASITPGEHLLYGTDKLNSRPIKPLVDALRQLGAKIDYCNLEGEAPLKIGGQSLIGGEITLDASFSSQFVSALMLIAPTLKLGLKINLSGVTSIPYIHLTQECLSYFGVKSSIRDNFVEVPYTPNFTQNSIAMQAIETDWSSAAFWYALCAVTGKSFRFENLSLKSIQGDIVCMELFRCLGVDTLLGEHEISIEKNNSGQDALAFNLQSCPDLAPALIIACALQNRNAKFYGLHTLQYKESSRAEALQLELKKLNINFFPDSDCWQLSSNAEFSNDKLLNLNCKLLTYNDHRLAMAFACVKAVNRNVEIEHDECVKKSYPFFWEEFFRIYV